MYVEIVELLCVQHNGKQSHVGFAFRIYSN